MPTAKGHSWRKLLLALATLSILLGALAWRRYHGAAEHIAATLRTMRKAGSSLSAEQCVDRVVTWSRNCLAMQPICESSAPRMMRACLRSADRRAYCATVQRRSADTRFGYHECRRRGATRGLPKKACASAYRAIDLTCRALSAASAVRNKALPFKRRSSG